MHICDCRDLPFEAGSKDVLIVQGGLHHLERLPTDLRQTLAEAHRVLRPGGLLIAIEPWSTPFLRLVHALCRLPWLRAASPKFEALSKMIELEAKTYFAWLSSPREILAEFRHFFDAESRISWGKLRLAGRRKEIAPERAREPPDEVPLPEAKR